jgi:DNA-directed RNA polymerase specialized sigma24 family protein
MTPTTPPAPSPSPVSREAGVAEPLHADDLHLVRRILAGDDQAWQQFVDRYAGLILAMARRYLRTRDQDDIRTVFVSVLESLRRTRFRTYEGRAALSTWLTLVARSEVIDHLRRQFGRDPKLRILARLNAGQRILFRLYYVEGLPGREVIRRLEAGGEKWSDDRFLEALHDIEARLGNRWLNRLSYDLHAQSIGASSGRLLEYLDYVRDELRQDSGSSSPEYHLMEREARRTVEALRASVGALRPRDQRLLELRFEQGWTARRIAVELGMKGQHGVYRAIERIVIRLRRMIPKAIHPEP